MDSSKRTSKQLKTILLCFSLLISGIVIYQYQDVYAYNFEGNESYYTEKCKSSNLTKSETETCQAFSEYLKGKNSDVQSSIDKTASLLASDQLSLQESLDRLDQITIEAENLQLEVNYLQASIEELEVEIAYKEGLIADRMYESQSYYNGNVYIDMIFGASSIEEFFSILSSITELTNYDEELILELNQDKKELEIKEAELLERKDELFQLEMQEQSLQNSLLETIDSYQDDLDGLNTLLSELTSDTSSIDQYVQNAKNRIAEEERQQQEDQNNANNNNNNGDTGNSGGDSTSDGSSSSGGDYGTGGSGIVAAALSKNGYPYVYGATGPNSFDCSGLTQWAHRQVGIYISRTVTTQLASGTSVSSSNLQPGDLVFYTTDGSGSASHVGIYIGGGQFIHAGTSSTGIYIANMNLSYWSSRYIGARRYY